MMIVFFPDIFLVIQPRYMQCLRLSHGHRVVNMSILFSFSIFNSIYAGNIENASFSIASLSLSLYSFTLSLSLCLPLLSLSCFASLSLSCSVFLFSSCSVSLCLCPSISVLSYPLPFLCLRHRRWCRRHHVFGLSVRTSVPFDRYHNISRTI